MTMEHPDADRINRITDAYREEQRENYEEGDDNSDDFFKTTALDRMIERYSNRDLSEEAQAELNDILAEVLKYKAICVELKMMLNRSIRQFDELVRY